MKQCTFCKGTAQEGLSTFTADLGDCIVIIRNVPSHICEQCGETYYTTEVMQQVYRIVQSVRDTMREITVVNYRPAA